MKINFNLTLICLLSNFRDWYTNASCRTWYRRRKLSSAFEHPSKMVYPPGHRYTPEPSPERTYSPTKRPPPKAWENRIPSREPIDTEIGLFQNESQLVIYFTAKSKIEIFKF